MANRPSNIMHFSPENRDTGGPRHTDINEKTLDKKHHKYYNSRL